MATNLIHVLLLDILMATLVVIYVMYRVQTDTHVITRIDAILTDRLDSIEEEVRRSNANNNALLHALGTYAIREYYVDGVMASNIPPLDRFILDELCETNDFRRLIQEDYGASGRIDVCGIPQQEEE